MEHTFQIAVSVSSPDVWRFNIVLTGGGFDSSGQRVDFASEHSHIANVGAQPEADLPTELPRTLAISLSGCERIVAYIYFVPYCLPDQRSVVDVQSFDAEVVVTQDEQTIFKNLYSVNPWGGKAIELKLP